MTVNVGELIYNGFTFHGTDGATIVTAVEGLDLPEVRSGDVELPGAHGSIPGQDRLGSRSIELDVRVLSTDLAALLVAMATAVAPRDDELPLTFRVADSVPEMRVYCRPRRRSVPLPQHHVHSNARCVLQFEASDPRIYSEAEYSANVGSPTASGGFTFPFTFPFNFGNPGSGTTANVTNGGTMPAPWRAVITGPCSGVTITGPGGKIVRWNGVLLTGETLEIDAHPARKTARLNGTASRFVLVAALSTWFLLAPGVNQLTFRSDDSLGTAMFFWRDAWWWAT